MSQPDKLTQGERVIKFLELLGLLVPKNHKWTVLLVVAAEIQGKDQRPNLAGIFQTQECAESILRFTANAMPLIWVGTQAKKETTTAEWLRQFMVAKEPVYTWPDAMIDLGTDAVTGSHKYMVRQLQEQAVDRVLVLVTEPDYIRKVLESLGARFSEYLGEDEHPQPSRFYAVNVTQEGNAEVPYGMDYGQRLWEQA